MYIIKINTKININENFSISEIFTKFGQFSTISSHLKKTDASREKLKMLKANSTPQACFFIRYLRTPKINLAIDLFSMVERKGQPLAVGYFPLTVVSHPFTLYRPTVRSLAESLNIQQLKDTAKMLYKFLLLGKNRLKIAIRANSEQQARNLLNLQSNALFVARINDKGGIYA